MTFEKEVMQMPQGEVSLAKVERLIDQLNEGDRLKLVKKLEVKTLPARWKVFLREIDKRRRKHPVSQREIEEIVEKVRQEIYERSRN